MLNKFIGFFSVPLMIMNFAAGIIGGIWLAVLGEWKLIGIGIFLLFTSHWFLSFFLLLSMPIASLGVYLHERNNPLVHVAGFISQLYTNVLIAGTCVLAFLLCSSYYVGENRLGYLPYLLWSWGMALGPWQFFFSKETDNVFSGITLFSASVFYLMFLISIFVSPLLSLLIIALFSLVQLIALPIFNMYIANQVGKYF